MFVFYEAPGPMTGNFPPPHAFFYHLNFEDVKLEIKQPELQLESTQLKWWEHENRDAPNKSSLFFQISPNI